MCGIAGIVGKSTERAAIENMVGKMHHRGPDDNGVFSDDNAAIGMARLAIIDLSRQGHQPMQSHCKRYWIVYNGECYNFSAIRQQLEKEGDRFVTHTDTEVVLQAYVRYGEKCLTTFNGMYAFAIWDTQEKKIFAARDRLGIKPFYYSLQQGCLVYGSEIKTVLASGKVNFKIDPESVFQYFTFGYIQQPRTILQDVKALMPGHFLTWHDGNLTIKKYWDITSGKITITYNQAKEELNSLINDAVRMQMVSDRPLGLFLSSGLDSASVLAAMHHNGVAIKSFSIGFEDNADVKNEANETKALAQYFGSDHHQLMIGSDTVRVELESFWKALDQPSVDGLNTYLVSKYAREHMTVALSGLGGDELFAGYSRHARILWKLAQGNSWQSVASHLIPAAAMGLEGGLGDLAFRLKAFTDRKDVKRNYTYARTLEHPGKSHHYLTSTLQQQIDPAWLYANQFQDVYDPSLLTNLDKVLGLDVKAFMSSVLLRDMDAASMWHSLEVRFPLIDHRLMEFAFSLPDSFKLGWDIHKKPRGEGSHSYRAAGTKKILADAMEKRLPPGLLDRPKNGFKLPIAKWLKGFGKEDLRAMLFDKRESWSPFLQENAVEQELSNFVSGKTNGQTFWKILTFVGVITNLERAAT